MVLTAKLLKELRDEAGLSQAKLAKLAKVSQAHIAKIESEKVDPRLSTVNRILRVLSSRDRRKRCKVVMNRNIISLGPDVMISDAVKTMREHGISQIPIMSGDNQVGSVDEATIIKNMDRKLNILHVKNIMDRPFPVVDINDPVDIAQPLLDFHPAVLVAEKGKLKGIITKVDLLGAK